MYSLILIERDPSLYASWKSLLKYKKISSLSVKEIVKKYQGFEGDLVYFYDFKNNLNEIKNFLKECFEFKTLGSCFLLHTISSPTTMPKIFKNKLIKLGYDVGVCDEEKTIYSSIFHEVLFGHLDELVNYKDKLNENFLFPNREIAEKYVKTHDDMSAQGKDVEDYEKMTIYEIWRQDEDIKIY